jgi:D-alanine transaminase
MKERRGAARAPSGRIAYVDGRYVPHGRAGVHIEDRGLQLSDSIYEVYSVANGKLLDEAGHTERLQRSLAALEMRMPLGQGALRAIMRELVRRNGLRDGLLYLQVTRGAHPRDHMIPADARPTLIMTTRRLSPHLIEERRRAGIAVVTRPDIRWGRCDIKATSLLPNVLAKTAARKAGAFEVWMVDGDGYVTEGASTNSWIVTEDGTAVTRDLSPHILAGVTRATLLRAAAAAKIRIAERAFTVDEAVRAREAFVTSATGGVIPVIRIDGKQIGNGKPGAATLHIHALYRELAEREAGSPSQTQ